MKLAGFIFSLFGRAPYSDSETVFKKLLNLETKSAAVNGFQRPIKSVQ